MSNKLIQALEPRLMLDGAAVATAIDAVDDLAQFQKSDNDKSSKADHFKVDKDTKLPFVNLDASAQNAKSRQIIFIDSTVEDIETLINSFDNNTEVHVIQSDQDGFVTMQNILSSQENIDAVHVIGHGSVGQIAFGTAVLNNDTLNAYENILQEIGSSLSENGDILFYGCNVAADQSGEILIKQIADITDADVAASDDVTGKGGDWDLEKHTGIIETKNITVADYDYALDAYGVDSINSSVVAIHDATNYEARWTGDSTNRDGQQDPSSDRFVLSQERASVTSGTGTLNFDVSGAASSFTPSSSNPVHVYLLFANDETNGNSRRQGDRVGQVTFDNEILGVFANPSNTIAMTGISKSGATYPTMSSDKIGMRELEYKNDNAPGQSGNGDWFAISNSNKTIQIGTKNGLKGDFIRIITRAPVENTQPVAQNDAGYINEDATLTVSNGANANDSTPDTSGEYTGDVINTSSSSHQDTDADGDTLIVTEIRTGSSEGSGTSGSIGSALTGTYGQLTMNQNGSYTYIANQSAADALDPGDTVTDSFNYTVDDQSGAANDTDKAVLTITIAGVNDPITAINDTDAVDEDATINRSTSDTQELDHDDTDPDGDDVSGSFTIAAIRTGRESGSGTSGTVGQALTGTYGVLTVDSDGSYSYAATTSGADGLAHGATAIDYFTYTVRDHSGGDTDTAELAITVTGVGPVAANDTGAVDENATLSKNAGAGVTANDTSGDTESLDVTAISSNGTGTSGTVGQALTGTYGVLTLNADGSYSYVANTAAAEALDAGDSVTDVFTYTVADDDDASTDTGTLTITITGVDDDPVGVNDTGAVNEDATLDVDQVSSGVLANDTDADADSSLTVSAISGGTVGQAKNGTYGALTLASNGTYTYVANQSGADGLAAGDTATDTFTYTVSDGAGTTDTATLTITVTGIGPQAVNDTGGVNEDATLTVIESSGVISNDDDNSSFDSESLAITGIRTGTESGSGSAGTVGAALTGTYGQLTIDADGSYEYVANQAAADALDPGDTVTDTFTYTVKDDDNKNADTGELVITVTGINDDITAVNDTDAVNANNTISRSTSDTQELDHDDTDPDADDVSGSFTITAIRTGASEGSGTAKTIGQAFTTTYGTMTVNADGSYTYAADQSGSTSLSNGVTATDSFNYTVQDHNSGDTDIATLVITITGRVDPVPSASDDAGYINEDATLTVTDGTSANDSTPDATGEHTGDVLLNDTHSGGDTLTVVDISNGSVGSAATGTFGQLTIAANGSYAYVANQSAADVLDSGDTGTDTFTYTVEDENGDQDTATITFTVAGLNDPITAVNDTDAVNEDATINRSTSDTQELDHDDTDPDGDDASGSFTITAIRTGREGASGTSGTIGQALTGTYGVLTVAADGSYSYAATTSGADGLAHGATAIDYFTYTVRDHSGGVTDTAELAITVTGVGPVASNDTGAVNEDVTLSVNAGSGVTSNDTSGDTESLAVTAIRTGTESGSGSSGTVGQSLTGTYGTLTINADGSYTYVADQAAADALDPSETATDTFTYTVADDNDASTDTGEIVITVTGTNDNIVAVNDTDAVNEDATVSRSTSDAQELDHDDTDADGDDASGLFTITAIRTGTESGSGNAGTIGQALTGTYGTLTVNADGSYTYVADQNAADSIVTGQTATDTFTYTVRDHNSGSTDTAELVFTVTGINDENPVAVDDTDTVPKGETITRAVGSTAALNSDDTDADGDTLTISGIRVGQSEGGGASGTLGSELVGTYGTLTLNADGSYSYVADQTAADRLKRGESAIEYFNYTVTDGTNEDIGVLAITVTGKSDPPVPVDDTLAIDAGATGIKDATNGVLNNDTDPDGDSLTVDTIRIGEESGTGTSGTIGSPLTGTYGDLTINSDGGYEYKANNSKALNPGQTATEYFTYTATDGETPVEAQIAITVTGINDPPEVINPIEVPVLVQGQKITIRHKQTFDDPDTGIYDITEYKIIDPETEAETSLPEGLSLRENKLTGRLTTPGTYTITIRAIDGAGLYADHTFTITVIPKVIIEPEVEQAEGDSFSLEPIEPIKVKPAKMQEAINEVNIIDDEGFTLDTISIADTASLSKPLKFNGGLRLMDAVASEVSGDDNTDLAIGVKLNDDNQKNVELYSGQLSNGDALPEWVIVNPETGETTAEMPEGVDQVEVQLVALDKDGNTRDINIVLDKAKIKNDQDFTRGTVGQTRVVVDNDANVNLIRENNNASNQTANNNLNAQTDFEGIMKLSSLQMDAGQYTIDVIDDNQLNVKMYKAELKGGGELPDWITIDPQTGKIAADPSKGRTGSAAPSFLTDSLQVLELKIIAEDEDGKERVIEVEIDLNEITGAETDDENSASDDEISFIPLDEQLKLHAKRADSYGEKIISLVS